MFILATFPGQESPSTAPSHPLQDHEKIRPSAQWVNTVNGSRQVLDSNYNYHSAKISGRQPGTLYHYQARTEQGSSDMFQFRAPPAQGTSTGRFRVPVLGDPSPTGRGRSSTSTSTTAR